MGTDPQGDNISGLVGRSIAGMINNYYLTELSSELRPEQIQGLLAVDEALDQAQDYNRSFTGTVEYDYPGLRLYEWRRQRQDSVMTRDDGRSDVSEFTIFKTPTQRLCAWLELKQGDLLPASRYEQLFLQHSAESVFRRDKLATLQLQLFDFDYADMQRPPDWPKDGPNMGELPW